MKLTEQDLQTIENEALKNIKQEKNYLSLKRYDEAKQQFTKAIELCPINDDFIAELAKFNLTLYQKKEKTIHKTS